MDLAITLQQNDTCCHPPTLDSHTYIHTFIGMINTEPLVCRTLIRPWQKILTLFTSSTTTKHLPLTTTDRTKKSGRKEADEHSL